MLKHPNKHILVCAPSNSAADIIAVRLIHSTPQLITPNNMFRLVAYSRSITLVDEFLRPYCLIKGDNFDCPSAEVLHRFKVIITTCAISSKLYNLGIDKNHFDVVRINLFTCVCLYVSILASYDTAKESIFSSQLPLTSCRLCPLFVIVIGGHGVWYERGNRLEMFVYFAVWYTP
jgi:hypothetical protein